MNEPALLNFSAHQMLRLENQAKTTYMRRIALLVIGQFGRIIHTKNTRAVLVNRNDADRCRTDFDAQHQIERYARAAGDRRLDRIAVADKRDNIVGKLRLQRLQRRDHTCLNLQHELPAWWTSAAAKPVEARPRRLTIEIFKGATLPSGELDFVNSLADLHVETEAPANEACRCPGSFHRAAVEPVDTGSRETFRQLFGLSLAVFTQMNARHPTSDRRAHLFVMRVTYQQKGRHGTEAERGRFGANKEGDSSTASRASRA